MSTVAVIDFETTGLSPDMGDRTTEVAVVMLEHGKIVDRYQSLMNAGARIPPFIESLTGITNAMVREAPPASEIMSTLAKFVGNVPLVAHNASFDRKFLDAELARINLRRQQQFACSMLLARRFYPAARDHKLGTLVRHLELPAAARHHRALADAEMTAHLWLRMLADVRQQYGLDVISHEFLCKLQKVGRAHIGDHLSRAQQKFRAAEAPSSY